MASGNIYPVIDLCETGKRLEKLIRKNGYTVRDLQYLLCLSCPQPVYRWLKGQVLPTVNHLYVIAKLLHVHMEELLVLQGDLTKWEVSMEKGPVWNRLFGYWKRYRGKAAGVV